MPSNSMKISQFITLLQEIQRTHDDLDVVLSVTELGGVVAVDGRNVNVAMDLPNGKLAQPALVLGMWQNEIGQLTSSPGQLYQHTADGRDDWNYNRDEAPLDTPLTVWKRYMGQDTGVRTSDGWFVHEGGAKLVQIIPAGILAWRLA